MDVEQTETQDPEQDGKLVPPYFAFKTLINQLDSMKERGIPARIDRSFLIGMAGAGQTQFMTGMRSLGLMDAAGSVDPKLAALANASVTERKRLLCEILRDRYAKAVELGKTNATTGQLVELWKDEYGATGDTARKGISFYLQAAAYAGDVPVSKLFTTPKVTSSGTRRRRPNGGGKPGGGAVDPSSTPPPPDPLAGARDLHPALAGVLIELPRRGRGWTQEQRDRFLKMFEMAVDFTIPVQNEPDDEFDDAPDAGGDDHED